MLVEVERRVERKLFSPARKLARIPLGSRQTVEIPHTISHLVMVPWSARARMIVNSGRYR